MSAVLRTHARIQNSVLEVEQISWIYLSLCVDGILASLASISSLTAASVIKDSWLDIGMIKTSDPGGHSTLAFSNFALRLFILLDLLREEREAEMSVLEYEQESESDREEYVGVKPLGEVLRLTGSTS